MAQYTGRQNPLPDYGPGSINRAAKKRLAAIPESDKQARPSLLNAILKPDNSPKNQSSAAIEDRINQQKQLKKEVGGRR